MTVPGDLPHSILSSVFAIFSFGLPLPFALVPQLKLDENQVSEQESLRIKLQKEQEMLSAYQSKQTMQLRAQHEREEKDLQDKVSVRRALLEEKVHYLVLESLLYLSLIRKMLLQI